MIPKILHIVWVGPHDPPQEAIDTWTAAHSGDRSWFFTLWRDWQQDWRNHDQMALRASKGEWNGVADLLRYEILHKFGGFVVDADSSCLMALDEGPLDFLASDTAVACYENESVRPGIIGCGFMGAPKGHPFFGACIEEAMMQDGHAMAWKTVGPLCITKVALARPEDITVYPARTFNPEHYSGTKAPGDAPIYARQHWGSTTTYNKLRKWPCQCQVCRNTASMIRPPWG